MKRRFTLILGIAVLAAAAFAYCQPTQSGPAMENYVLVFLKRAPNPPQPYRMNYDVMADGSRFLITTPVEGTRTEASIAVVLNWLSDIRKK